MKSIILIVGALLITTLLIIGVAYGFTKVSQKQVVVPTAGAQATADNTSIDWGEIKYTGGKVKATYRITNNGTETLKLYGATTSCACTSATITANGKVSPSFGMHAPLATTIEVAPGKDAIVEALFDPAFHGPGGIGPITRTITIQTNDPSHQTLSLQASGVVVK